jgi:hypothetical protein
MVAFRPPYGGCHALAPGHDGSARDNPSRTRQPWQPRQSRPSSRPRFTSARAAFRASLVRAGTRGVCLWIDPRTVAGTAARPAAARSDAASSRAADRTRTSRPRRRRWRRGTRRRRLDHSAHRRSGRRTANRARDQREKHQHAGKPVPEQPK